MHLSRHPLIDFLPQSSFDSWTKVVINGLTGWQVMGHRSPLASMIDAVEDGIETLSEVNGSGTSKFVCFRE
jgi:hypothetical protein